MKKALSILLCAAAAISLTACKKKPEAAVPAPSVSMSKDGTPYKEPTGGGNGGTIIDDNNKPVSSNSSRFNYISTSEIEEVYEFDDYAGKVTILRYRGEGGKVLIPSVIGGKPVVKIEDHAFRGTDITSVTVPGSVKAIGTHSFSGCDYLAQLTIADGVETIEGYAFANCKMLTLVSLPDSIREIAAGSFRDCPNIRLTYKGETYTSVNIEELYKVF